MPNAQCELAKTPGERNYLKCLGRDEFVKDVFLDSDTDLMVLSFVPSTREGEPLTIEEAPPRATSSRRWKARSGCMLHGRVNPNQPGDLEDMERLAEARRRRVEDVHAVGPGRQGLLHDDDVGIAFIEKARKLGVRNIGIHKGLPFGPKSYEHSTCARHRPVAKRFPDVNFLIYHSGFVIEQARRPVRSEAHRRHRCAGHLRAERTA